MRKHMLAVMAAGAATIVIMVTAPQAEARPAGKGWGSARGGHAMAGGRVHSHRFAKRSHGRWSAKPLHGRKHHSGRKFARDGLTTATGAAGGGYLAESGGYLSDSAWYLSERTYGPGYPYPVFPYPAYPMW
jgi:hypothetical protein